MGKQLVLGSVLGAIVLFVWSAIAWMLIPWPGEPLRTFTNEDAVAQAIKANAPRSGNYLLPNEPKRTAGMTNEQYQKMEQEAADRMSRGPVIFAAVRLEPIIFVGGHLDEWNWWSFSNAYIAMQAGAIVIGWLLASFVMATVVRGKVMTKQNLER